MIIILGMTSTTGCTHLRGRGIVVALLAVQQGVGAVDNEAGLGMVKADLIPTIRIMA